MRTRSYQWPLVLGSVLGAAALIVAFSQPPSEPVAFNDAIWHAGWLAGLALLSVGAGVLLRLRRDNDAGGALHTPEAILAISRRSRGARSRKTA